VDSENDEPYREERLARMREYERFLEKKLAEVESGSRVVPFFALTMLLAIPAGLFWGGLAAIYVAGMGFALMLVGFYLTGLRRSWTATELDDLRRERRKLEGGPPAPRGTARRT
jgi:hypothetical protein